MTESKARPGEDLSLGRKNSASAVADVKAEISGFLSHIKSFQAEVKETLQHQKERLTMLDRKVTTYARPALSAVVEMDVPHRKAFNAYLRSGDDDGLRGL